MLQDIWIYDIYVNVAMFYDSCRGEQEDLCRGEYNLFTTGRVSLQGEFSCTQVVIIKKGENVETYSLMIIDFDDNKCDACTLELNLQS